MHVEGIQPSHVIEGTQTSPAVAATPAPSVAARPVRVWPAFVALALFWAYFFGCDWVELTTPVKRMDVVLREITASPAAPPAEAPLPPRAEEPAQEE